MSGPLSTANDFIFIFFSIRFGLCWNNYIFLFLFILLLITTDGYFNRWSVCVYINFPTFFIVSKFNGKCTFWFPFNATITINILLCIWNACLFWQPKRKEQLTNTVHCIMYKDIFVHYTFQAFSLISIKRANHCY